MRLTGDRRRTIATALATTLGDQSFLLDQQGQTALQHPRRKIEFQPITNSPDLHSVRVIRHDCNDGLKLLFGNLFGHTSDYMSRKAYWRHINALFVAYS